MGSKGGVSNLFQKTFPEMSTGGKRNRRKRGYNRRYRKKRGGLGGKRKTL